MKRRKRFLITGGAGFIGRNLAYFLTKKNQVTILDTKIFDSDRQEFKRSGIICLDGDIRYFKRLVNLFSGMDGVFHCGAYAKIKESIENPKLAKEVNVGGTLNVLMAAKVAGVKRVVYSASSSVYGLQGIPWHEYLPAQPLNPYAVSKYVGELLCEAFALFHGLETVSLRYANVYGSALSIIDGQREPPSVIELLLRQKKEGRFLTIIDDGSQRRDFVNVDDVAAANLRAMTSPFVGRGEVINIGLGKNYSIAELAQLVGGPTVSIASRYEEPTETLLDISRAKALLDWEPKIDVRDWIVTFSRVKS